MAVLLSTPTSQARAIQVPPSWQPSVSISRPAPLMRTRSYLAVLLICISLMANDAQNLFHPLICHLYAVSSEKISACLVTIPNWAVCFTFGF